MQGLWHDLSKTAFEDRPFGKGTTMNIIRMYRSKKYLQRLVLSFSILVLLLLVVFSGTLYANAGKIILDMQREANAKVLSQIKFNVTYLNDVIQRLVMSLYYDNDIVPLMTATEDSDIFDTLTKRSRIDKFADYTPFIHSIMIYNAKTDRFLWGGDPAVQDRDAPIYANMRSLFQGTEPIPKLSMVPMSLSRDGSHADVFSIFDYDSIDYRQGESVFVLNIRPQWLFDNIKLINRLAWQENENVFILSDDGTILSPDTGTAPVDGAFKQAILAHVRQEAAEKNGYFKYSLGSKPKLVNYMDAGINGWTLISIQSYETLVSKADSLKNTSIVLTAIFLLLALLATLGIAHRLYRPLGKLVNFIRQGSDDEAGPKPPDGDELSYMSSIYQDTRNRLLSARNEQVTTRHIVRSYYIRKIITDSAAIPPAELSELIHAHKLMIEPAGPYLLGVMKLDEADGAPIETPGSDRRLLHFAIANIAQELLAQTYPSETVELKNDHLAALISVPDVSAPTLGRVQREFARIQDVIAKMYGVTFSAVLSEGIQEHRNLSDRYALSLQQARYTLVYGPQSLITPAMIRHNASDQEAALPAELEKKLAESMKSNQEEAFEKTLHKIFEFIASQHYDYMVYMALHVFILMKQVIKEMNEHRIVPLSIELADLNRKIMDSPSLDGMRLILLGVYREIHVNKRSPEQERNEILVETIRDIIGQNYADTNLSLQMIGDTMKLSPDYIGKLFKKQQGVSVAEFINDARLRQAVQYLEQGNYTINDLIERIGFGTRSNFFRLFKNKYGTTPKEYRIKRNLAE
ncbi:AraC family transcriptional regulator [Paenibacillus sacheonensis]|uniref:Helix-turn-helix domain-containing protein n=1 Tax=Paenibacillus sacheonensis TaxID=742054 RepID=A0A7X4YSV7_9BACL|nr:AraC family transcriptional regulator [Paenibacillus sacheonensis]NBC71936.1 helix-turn-helix domain-containing protein [Paenibacillus sacheonensis]